MNDAKIIEEAREFAKRNPRIFIDMAIDEAKSSVAGSKLAIFMAGTPGSGKTEYAEELAGLFNKRPVMINADLFREKFEKYNGENSYLFQSATNVAVEKVFDKVIHDGYSFILDTTFSSKNATLNIKRALDHGFRVQIYFIFQQPKIAWGFTQSREKIEGRNIPLDSFITSYFRSRENVEKAMNDPTIGPKIVLTVIEKEFNNKVRRIHPVEHNLANFTPLNYTETTLRRELSHEGNAQ
ncbi:MULTISPECIES: zeta toxin family protein [Bifidobacterium]|jgi:predicted ABC-type ATPase|uniref:UDP-N-acetylglucosamine kinase n=1 Tax=Bifidobacterium subtile TaxID=77635 RepID=A0A087E6Z4_9BIFI|nr:MULTISPECIES: zeta toxin family protein [Bifidobacterium]KFJ03545.1 zeta toxin [Bifidobacterium subtile]MCI1649472.1 zeta toxin family protein [Bifidobacterium tibiigranuli]MCI1674565.1 zeta toxin family protein [Bifidobacterium tibiigranuli]MCI1714147.1 zeta toxin family protein [Bifidobacterium tibiigranuli]MCI2186166.1 zeta toxin family protein [Bifidobacterium tibiigranuli]